VPDISPVRYDIRNLLKAARTINNDEPFPGERLLHRLLGKTYYAHILPPLPDHEHSMREAAEAEFSHLLGKGAQNLAGLGDWLQKVPDDIKSRAAK
jgi:oleate hydratase